MFLSKRSMTVCVTVPALLAFAGVSGMARRTVAEEREDKGQPHREPRKVVAATPKVQDVILTQQYVCHLRPRRHITVRALQSGYLQEILVKEGQAVKQGGVMFKILPTLYKARLDAERAEADLAQIEFNRVKKLSEQNLVSNDEVAIHQAKLDKARAKAKLAEAELKLFVVSVPFDGVVGRLHEQPGSLVKEGAALTTLTDDRVMWAYFNVPEARYLEYKAAPDREREGWKIELVLANGSTYPGKLGATGAKFNSATGGIPFRADFENPNGLLRPGQTGNVLIHRSLKNAIVIPPRATFEKSGKRYVYAIDKDGVAHQRQVVVRDELEDGFVVNEGLGVNDRIIVEGAGQVRDGDTVEYKLLTPQQHSRHRK